MAELQRTEIAARIKQARIEAGFTQPEMADLLTVAARTYQNYESDRVPWSLLGLISEATSRSMAWLLHGEDPPAGDMPALINRLDDLELTVAAKLDELLDIARPAVDPADVTDVLTAGIEEQRAAAEQPAPGSADASDATPADPEAPAQGKRRAGQRPAR